MIREKLINELKGLVGESVLRKGHACNSLNFVIGEISFWIDPSWRYEKNGISLIASGDFLDHSSYETEEEYEKDFYRCCEVTNDIKGSTLEKIEITEQNDLYMFFSGSQVIRAYQAFIEDNDANWYISIPSQSIRYLALPNEIKTEKITRNKAKQAGTS